MYVVALTGGIGSGKSTVSGMLAERGALVIDADQLAREVVEPGSEGFREVVERFGEEVATSEGSLDRQRLAAIVFDDEDARRDLNAIIHPRVHERIAARLAELEGSGELGPHGIVVVDVPLLVEAEVSGAPQERRERSRLRSPETATEADDDRPYHAVVVIVAPEEVRIARLVRERGMDPGAVRARIEAQASDEERLAAASHVLDNSGDLDDLERQVVVLHEELAAEASGGR
ncbi:MAG: dephospho-CoA kinase [Actinomycetota bacterium]|nr:dephospho-CoA kinase [Actinomycetota bacterium]